MRSISILGDRIRRLSEGTRAHRRENGNPKRNKKSSSKTKALDERQMKDLGKWAERVMALSLCRLSKSRNPNPRSMACNNLHHHVASAIANETDCVGRSRLRWNRGGINRIKNYRNRAVLARNPCFCAFLATGFSHLPTSAHGLCVVASANIAHDPCFQD